jgi:hypothetical protein
MSTPSWLAFVEKLAPTVASAIGGPIGGMAVTAIEGALGITGGDGSSTDKIEAAITAGQLTGEQLAALKKADQDFAAKMKELDIQADQLQLADVEGARQMQVATPSNVPALLSGLIVLGYFGALIAMMFGVDVTDNNAFLIMLGALTGALTQVLNYWFGSTRHSQATASLLAQNTAAAAAQAANVR